MEEINLVFLDNKIRLDIFIANNTSFSRSLVKKIINSNNVLVNNMLINKTGYILKKNDNVLIKSNKFLINNYENIYKWENNDVINVIYENEDFLIIDKPNNIVVHPSNSYDNNTLVNALVWKFTTLDYNLEDRPGIVHRLDKATTGLMIVSKHSNFTNWITEQFQNRTIEKTYLAILDGSLKNSNGIIDAPLSKDFNSKKVIIGGKNSKKAITNFRILENFNDYTLVEFKPKTGRTHQLRVHSNYINHPIANDTLYNGKKVDDFEYFGQFLHAYKISFIGLDNKKYQFESKLPIEFENFITKLRKEKEENDESGN